jgi:hypothetical protein
LDDQLRFAIAKKRLIQLSYEGSRRLGEPHDYGVQKGITRVLVYQLRKSAGSPRDAVGWRLLETVKISDCVVLEQEFPGTRARSDQRHHAWDVLYARVA